MDKETYTYSRALHLMRYSGAVMSSVVNDIKFRVVDEILEWFDTHREKWVKADVVYADVIMDSWVEVKQ